MSDINHSGIITKIENGIAEVLINDHLSCEGCGAKNACISGSSKDKKFHISLDGQNYKTGDEVRFSLSQRSAMNAVAWAYVIPFFVLIFSLIIFSFFFSEIKAALLSLALLAIYYLLVYINRQYFDKNFSLKLKNSSDE
jgi:sigma-E factor negative regulatory protein RseC